MPVFSDDVATSSRYATGRPTPTVAGMAAAVLAINRTSPLTAQAATADALRGGPKLADQQGRGADINGLTTDVSIAIKGSAVLRHARKQVISNGFARRDGQGRR